VKSVCFFSPPPLFFLFSVPASAILFHAQAHVHYNTVRTRYISPYSLLLKAPFFFFWFPPPPPPLPHKLGNGMGVTFLKTTMVYVCPPFFFFPPCSGLLQKYYKKSYMFCGSYRPPPPPPSFSPPPSPSLGWELRMGKGFLRRKMGGR